MHDAVFCTSEEVSRPAKAVQHTRAHYAGTVCVGVDVNFDGGVHADHSQSPDDLGAVGDLLGAKEKFRCVFVPPVVKALEAFG